MLNLSFLSLALTIGTYLLGVFLQKKWKSPLCNPLVISLILMLVILLATGYPQDKYQRDMSHFGWLLTPATVSLAYPLYTQLQRLKGSLWIIFAGIAAGTVASLVSIVGLSVLFGLDSSLIISILPKSVTTAIGTALSEELGGISSLTAVAIAISGIGGSLIGPWLCKTLRFSHPIAQGVALGTTSHMIGTAKATELGELQSAVSSLSLTVAGILTAILMPIICMLL